jgi:hypothetical protein
MNCGKPHPVLADTQTDPASIHSQCRTCRWKGLQGFLLVPIWIFAEVMAGLQEIHWAVRDFIKRIIATKK